MNRGRSSDSLDNGLNDIISSGSSSPTNFTSDDETGDLNYSNVLNPSLGARSRLSNSETGRKVDKHYTNPNGFNDRIQRAIQNASQLRQIPGTHNNHLSGHHHLNNDTAVASTSYYNKREPTSGIDLHPSQILNVLPRQGTRSTSTDDDDDDVDDGALYSRAYDERRMLYNTASSTSSHNRPQIAGGSSGGVAIANIGGYSDIVDRNVYLEENPTIEQAVQAMAGPSRGPLGTLTARLCSKLVECRTLAEAIEFISCNRDVIDNMTRIVTREAPAFRDYDMSNYQIDCSVRESFNPNFWLDREPVITTADGNCQYHAISLSLTGSEMYTQEVRLATAVAVVDHREYFDSILKLIDRGTVLDLVHTIARSFSWGDETTLKAIAVAIKRRIFLYTCNIGKKDYEMVKSLSKEELLDAFKEKKYRGGTGIHTYADPHSHVPANNYIMLFHKSEHFIAVLATSQQPTMFEPYNPIVPTFIS